MLRVHRCLGGEPWCFAPDQIARLTDYQVMSLYLRPAAERAAALERKSGGGTAADPPAAPEVPRQGALWDYLTRTVGMTPDEAAKAVGA